MQNMPVFGARIVGMRAFMLAELLDGWRGKRQYRVLIATPTDLQIFSCRLIRVWA